MIHVQNWVLRRSIASIVINFHVQWVRNVNLIVHYVSREALQRALPVTSDST